MSGEDHTLPVELGRLEIVSGKGSASTTCGDENPFQRRSVGSRASPALWGRSCNCSLSKKAIRHKGVFKRNSGKLLKDPVLKYVNTCCHGGPRSEELATSLSSVSLSPLSKCVSRTEEAHIDRAPLLHVETAPVQNDFRSLVSSCSQLRISNTTGTFTSESFQNLQCRDSSNMVQAAGATGAEGRAGGLIACSQQALNPPCDVTIDELASYFETLVHIPKKMSTMAEMMYI